MATIIGFEPLEFLFNDIAAWSNATFGDESERGPVGPLKHIVKEIEGELLPHDPKDVIELADVLILLLDATRRAGYDATQLVTAAITKMAINKKRTYRRVLEGEVSEHDRSRD